MRAEYLNKSKRDGIEMMDQFHQKQFFIYLFHVSSGFFFIFGSGCNRGRNKIQKKNF